MKSLFEWPWDEQYIPPENRETSSRFRVDARRSRKEIKEELERFDVDEKRIEEGPDNEVIVRWLRDGNEFAIGCCHYKTLKSNLREAYLWVEETRKRSDRNVAIGRDEFAAAALPSGEEGGSDVTPTDPPHEILEVAPNASDNVIKAAARQKLSQYSPDGGETPDKEMFIKVQKARKAMLGGDE